MKAQHRRNFRFFDAPVGMIFTIHRKLETGSWLDYGMFLQNVMTVARARGLDTCAQAAWSQYHRIIRSTLGVSEEEIVVCGMALGYADRDAPVNAMKTVTKAAFARLWTNTLTRFLTFMAFLHWPTTFSCMRRRFS